VAVVNGQMSPALLVSVGGGQALRADAAAAWLAVVAEVQARFGIVLRLTDSYRPYSVQVRIFNERYDPASSGSGPFGDVRWWGGVRYVRMRGASAAVPGTSNHGLGVAVDVTDLGGFTGANYEHLAEVAPAHGWSNKAGRKIGEPWHWEYTPADDTHPTSAPAQEDDMPLTDLDITRIRDEAVYPLWRAPEMAAILQAAAKAAVAEAAGPAVWDHRLAKADETPVAAKAWLVDTRIIVGQLTSPGATAAISTADLARIARAVADEQARRLVT